jgi:hypothetical protein
MVDKNKVVTQLAERIDSQSALTLNDKQRLSLYKKSQKSGISVDILEEVYFRGIFTWNESINQTPEQYAFGRVNSFIAGGQAMELDEDLILETTAALKKKAAASGVSLSVLRKVYNRGVAAWRTGHRPGTTPQQWGMARVNSYITKGKGTYHGADKDLREASLPEVPKDEETGLPKKYTTGEKSTDKARASHFAKGREKHWDDPSAYEKAPGDATAKTKESKHTKKYREMYGEESECAEPQSSNPNDSSSRFIGTDSLVNIYMKNTPGQSKTLKAIKDVVRDVRESEDLTEKATSAAQQRLMGAALAYKRGENKNASPEVKKLAKSMSEKDLEDFARTKHKGLPERVDRNLEEAEYKGKKVTLNKPFRTPGGPKKSAVYVDPDGDGKAKIVRFGDPNLSIKKHRPARKRSYCARSSGQGNLTDKGSANYWSRKAWDC